MKLSIRLSIGSHKKTFTFASEKVLLVIFSLIVAALVTIDKVRAEDKMRAENLAGAEVAVDNVSTAIAAVPVASRQTLLPAATVSPTTISTNKPILPEPEKISSASQLANLLGGLLLILGLIYGLSWFVKRFSQGGFMQNSTIKMLSAMPLGTRERIMLVDIGGKQILLGITATNINALHVFDEPVVNTAENPASVTSDFSQKLMMLLKKDMVKKDMVQENMEQQNDLSNSSFSNLKNTKK
jgi:flagellar protein FliO/FliZ